MGRKKQETLVLFPEVTTITRKFTDAQFGALMRAVFSYRFNGEVYSGEDAAVDVAFQAVMGQIDRYQEFCHKQAENAKGNDEEPSTAKGSQNQPSTPPYPRPGPYPYPSPDIEDTGIIGAGSSPTTTQQRFKPPSADDVRAYAIEKGYTIDPEAFVDYYESNGWKVGKNSMRSWKAAVRTWARKECGNAINKRNFKQRENQSVRIRSCYEL